VIEEFIMTDVSKQSGNPYQHLVGQVTVFYQDPFTRFKREGRARIVEVLGSTPTNETQEEVHCLVHFVGDRRKLAVQRSLAQRRMTLK